MQNWVTTEEGYKVCLQEHVFDQNMYDKYDERGDYLRIIQHMGSEESCEGCPFEGECCKSKKHRKIVSRDAVLEEMYGKVDENLSGEFGEELKKQRSIQVGGAFGVIKQDMQFTRFTRRGLTNAKMEFLIVCLGYNLKKYHKYRLRQEKENKQKSFVN